MPHQVSNELIKKSNKQSISAAFCDKIVTSLETMAISSCPAEDIQTYMPKMPTEIIKLHGEYLTPFEHNEILSYPEIYYIGADAIKISGDTGKRYNCGYDDSKHLYFIFLGDHIGYRYQIVGLIGKGTYGQVVEAYDHKNQKLVALKIIRNGERYRSAGEKEIKILKHLLHHDKDNRMNVIHMVDNFDFRNHMCITFELLATSLRQLLRRNKYSGFSIERVKKFGNSLLQCLVKLNELKIIHGDLKPDNILLKQDTGDDIKVIDFGLSFYENKNPYLTVGTLYYQAPEILLQATDYSMAIDMWSLACILAELFTGRPLFCGIDELDQMACIVEVLGIPPDKLLSNIKRTRKFMDSDGVLRYCSVEIIGETIIARGAFNAEGNYRGVPGFKTLKAALKNCKDERFLDFLEKCLEYDPEKRMTPNMALSHPWITTN